MEELAIPTLDLTALVQAFPSLVIESIAPRVVLSGQFELVHNEEIIDSYDVEIVVEDFPQREPQVFELSGRVKQGQHRNPDGTCCTGVFEVWRAKNPAASLTDFLSGPVRQFFLGHWEVERGRPWPFGELSHGEDGIIEAAADLLSIPAAKQHVIEYLRFLGRPPRKRHRRCPCGSGKRLRSCHGDELRSLHERISSDAARAILKRIRSG